MSLLLNILWIVLGGFVIALQYLLGGVLLCLTVVGIPFGVQCFKLAELSLLPFGRTFEGDPAASPISLGLNIFWILVAGIWIFLTHVGLAISLACTVIGIPFAIQHMKLAALALAPFGQRVRAA